MFLPSWGYMYRSKNRRAAKEALFYFIFYQWDSKSQRQCPACASLALIELFISKLWFFIQCPLWSQYDSKNMLETTYEWAFPMWKMLEETWGRDTPLVTALNDPWTHGCALKPARGSTRKQRLWHGAQRGTRCVLQSTVHQPVMESELTCWPQRLSSQAS